MQLNSSHALEIPPDAVEAQIESHYGTLLNPKVNGVSYRMVISDCRCADLKALKVYYAQCEGEHFHRFYGKCAEHGVKSLGVACKAETDVDWRRIENRRHAGATTEPWHTQRGTK
jgi:hypothetical protein